MQFIPGSIELENRPGDKDVWALLQNALVAQEGQCGYRLPSVGVSVKEDVPSFITVSNSHGIVLVDVIDDHIARCDADYWILDNNDALFSRDIAIDKFVSEIENRLRQDHTLYDRKAKQLHVPIHKLLIFYRNSFTEVNEISSTCDILSESLSRENLLSDLKSFFSRIKQSTTGSNKNMDRVIAVLEGTPIFEKRKKRPQPGKPVTKNDYIQKSLDMTFKLDETQRKISMQLPAGVQRIRGLAGTGKTVILSMKAALTHKDFPDYNILFVFNTQSMYSHIRDLVSKYYTFEARKEPNLGKLEILHAWGGKAQPGLYSTICDEYGIRQQPYFEVRNLNDPLEAIYAALLEKTRANLKPKYDMVLIDEAQDFPPKFFEMIYRLTKPPKRIVWAYDEFQSLKELKIREPEDLFGKDAEGRPNIPNSALHGTYSGGIEKDFILPNCYRTPRITLMTAHGLALGLYREAGIIDVVSDRRSWEALGYRVASPSDRLTYYTGDEMDVERPEEYSKNILESLLRRTEGKPKDQELVKVASFMKAEDEMVHVIDIVHDLVVKEQVEPAEVMIITLDLRNSESHLTQIRQGLDAIDIKSIMPGYIEKSSIFKKEGFITLTTPFRAKGNEANVVIVINAQRAVEDLTFRARNALFVAITRSRGWTFITGNGGGMTTFLEECDRIFADYPKFIFMYPDEDDIARRRVILSKSDFDVEQQQQALDKLLKDNKELIIERLSSDPEFLQTLLDAKKKNAN